MQLKSEGTHLQRSSVEYEINNPHEYDVQPQTNEVLNSESDSVLSLSTELGHDYSTTDDKYSSLPYPAVKVKNKHQGGDPSHYHCLLIAC